MQTQVCVTPKPGLLALHYSVSQLPIMSRALTQAYSKDRRGLAPVSGQTHAVKSQLAVPHAATKQKWTAKEGGAKGGARLASGKPLAEEASSTSLPEERALQRMPVLSCRLGQHLPTWLFPLWISITCIYPAAQASLTSCSFLCCSPHLSALGDRP